VTNWTATSLTSNTGTATVVSGGFNLNLAAAIGPNGWQLSNAGNTQQVTLTGSAQADSLVGGTAADTLSGGAGNDTFRGGQDNDVVSGGDGGDFVSGDKGDDTMAGGSGADIFHTFGDAGIDRVLDFNLSAGDRVQLGPGTQFTTSQVGEDTVINMTGGGQMVLVGVSLTTLTGNWIFGA
jgi:Ca2+-binding RTX toxin-like protein